MAIGNGGRWARGWSAEIARLRYGFRQTRARLLPRVQVRGHGGSQPLPPNTVVGFNQAPAPTADWTARAGGHAIGTMRAKAPPKKLGEQRVPEELGQTTSHRADPLPIVRQSASRLRTGR
jgi:hypothetical protein